MEREDIGKYAEECAEDNMVVHGDYPFYPGDYEEYKEAYIKTFNQGVEYADSHPKSPWISVKDDLPCNHSELLDPENTAVKMETIPVLTGISFNIFSVGWMEKRQGKWVWHSTIEPQYWMPIPKLPKNSE